MRVLGGVVCSSTRLCVHPCTGMYPWKHCGQVDGWREDRTGYGYEPFSPHTCIRALGLREQLQSLREELEQVAQKGRARRVQSAELNSDLCKAHRWVPLPCTSPGDRRSIPGSQLPSCRVFHPIPSLVPDVCQPLLSDAGTPGRPNLGVYSPCLGWGGGLFPGSVPLPPLAPWFWPSGEPTRSRKSNGGSWNSR